MMRTYDHHGFTLEVNVEAGRAVPLLKLTVEPPSYVAVVRVFRAGRAIATFSPLRFVEAGGRPFDTEVDALMGGYSAARRIVDNLFGQESR